jgi:hypothetical protein
LNLVELVFHSRSVYLDGNYGRRPFGTDFRVQPQPFELLLDEIEGNRRR